jgi:hypothetical protein
MKMAGEGYVSEISHDGIYDMLWRHTIQIAIVTNMFKVGNVVIYSDCIVCCHYERRRINAQ